MKIQKRRNTTYRSTAERIIWGSVIILAALTFFYLILYFILEFRLYR